jgi:hypothetical protein
VKRRFRSAHIGYVLILCSLLAAAAAHAGPRVVNGLPTQARPTTGALLRVSGGSLSHACSGTLVGCETFLTAAHCVCPGSTFCTPTPGDFAVYLQNVGVVTASAIEVHPSYLFGSEADVAVVTLSIPTTGVPPTPINDQQEVPFATAATIAGFGVTQGNRNDSGLLREGDTVTASCAGEVPEDEHLCWLFDSPLGDAGTDSNTCSGDSGGPLFADLGGGEIVVGVTSGGSAFDCLPEDLSYDTDVFQNLAFIQGVAGADLANTSCGAHSQVGDVDTEIVRLSAGVAPSTALKCRKAITNAHQKYVGKVLGAYEQCLNDVNSGAIAGPCPDVEVLDDVAKAASKLTADRLERRCPASALSTVGLAGDCATVNALEGSAALTELESCLIGAGDDARSTLHAVQYADDAPAVPLASPELVACQARIAKSMLSFHKKTQKVRVKCQIGQDKDKITNCLDSKSEAKITFFEGRVESDIAKSCTDGDIVALDTGNAFGGTCAGVTSVADLTLCQISEQEVVALDLMSLLDDIGGAVSSSFIVEPGTDRFRVTVNGVEDGFNDLDIYVRQGAPASVSTFDFSSTANSVFEGVEVVSPTAGEWFVFIGRLGGDIPMQLTVTQFQP